MNPLLIILGVIGGIFALVVFGLAFNIIGLWFQSVVSGAKSGLFDLIMMRFRKVNPRVIVVNRITAKKAGIDIPTDWLEAHFLAGGRVGNVVMAMIAAEKAGIDLVWDRATAIDLAGRDILDAVRASVDPRVIDCPNPDVGKATIDAVAMDGIQLKARARVTVRTNIDRLVGGATEETIIARVGEGIVSAIGSAETHKEVLENPDRISKGLLGDGPGNVIAFSAIPKRSSQSTAPRIHRRHQEADLTQQLGRDRAFVFGMAVGVHHHWSLVGCELGSLGMLIPSMEQEGFEIGGMCGKSLGG